MKNDETMYDIKDLRIVMLNKDYIKNNENDYINYFNENIKFITEKFLINEKTPGGNEYYAEYYTECITEEDLSTRISDKPFCDNPKIFSLVSRIPKNYFTEEELESGKISLIRIYKVFQDININKEKKQGKIKRFGKKKK